MATIENDMKFCKYCGEKIQAKAVICPHCGCQVEEMRSSSAQPNIVIQNTNTNTNTNINRDYGMGYPRSKWKAFFLCLFFGFLGAHKFYEGKNFVGVLYLLTLGIVGIGWTLDCIILLFKSNPYYVKRT